MAKYFLLIFLAVMIAFAAAIPIPDYGDDGREILEGREGYSQDLPFFGFRRPLEGNGDGYYGAGDSEYVQPIHHHHHHHHDSIPLYETAGAGWGR